MSFEKASTANNNKENRCYKYESLSIKKLSFIGDKLSSSQLSNYICLVCKEIPLNPIICLECQSIFCNKCYCSELKCTCKICLRRTSTKMGFNYFKSLFKNAMFNCSLSSSCGCFTYEKILSHMNTCHYGRPSKEGKDQIGHIKANIVNIMDINNIEDKNYNCIRENDDNNYNRIVNKNLNSEKETKKSCLNEEISGMINSKEVVTKNNANSTDNKILELIMKLQENNNDRFERLEKKIQLLELQNKSNINSNSTQDIINEFNYRDRKQNKSSISCSTTYQHSPEFFERSKINVVAMQLNTTNNKDVESTNMINNKNNKYCDLNSNHKEDMVIKEKVNDHLLDHSFSNSFSSVKQKPKTEINQAKFIYRDKSKNKSHNYNININAINNPNYESKETYSGNIDDNNKMNYICNKIQPHEFHVWYQTNSSVFLNKENTTKLISLAQPIIINEPINILIKNIIDTENFCIGIVTHNTYEKKLIKLQDSILSSLMSIYSSGLIIQNNIKNKQYCKSNKSLFKSGDIVTVEVHTNHHINIKFNNKELDYFYEVGDIYSNNYFLCLGSSRKGDCAQIIEYNRGKGN